MNPTSETTSSGRSRLGFLIWRTLSRLAGGILPLGFMTRGCGGVSVKSKTEVEAGAV